MTQLRHEQSSFEAAGVELVVVGNGAPHFIAGFREKTGFDGTLYTDPELRAYRALELKRGLRSSFNLRSMGRAWKAYASGNRQTAKTQGDPWQQGGVFVIVPGGEIVYSYPSEYAGDHPPVSALLAAAEQAVAR